MRIDILNPKAEQLLKDLADLNLISIREPSENDFADMVQQIRSKAKFAPIMEEITKEIEEVRAARYEK